MNAAADQQRHALALACLAAASDHPARGEVANEIHARPFLRIEAPARVTHLAVLGEAGEGDALHLRLAEDFCAALQLPPPSGSRHFVAGGDGLQVKWERHNEFSTFTVVGPRPAGEPFADFAAMACEPHPAWFTSLSGRRLAALSIEVLQGDAARAARRERSRWFAEHGLVGSRVLGGGEVWCDWRIGADGLSRFLVLDLDFRENQAGRLVQRLAEIETYRLMALLALPLARDMLASLEALERELAGVMRRMAADRLSSEDPQLLLSLTDLAGQIEALSGVGSRFSASQAYYRLVLARIAELREERIEGVPTIGEFMERRLAPAMDTCHSAQLRQASLALRVARAIDLLRTRVNVVQEKQVTELLHGMNRTAGTQLKLQHAVEGLSVVAISYYAVSLFSHLLTAAQDLGLHFNASLAEGVSIPVVIVLAFLAVRGTKRKLQE